MGWILLLLRLFTYFSGSFSQFTLTQPASQSAAMGGTAQLSCTMSGLTFGFFEWYQQKEGTSPKFLLTHKVSSGETTFGSEFSRSRFAASTDNPKKVAYLRITNVTAKDEATYYCGAGHSSNSSYVWIFGGGTQMTVTGQPASPPAVNLFPPSADEIQSKNKATLVCLMDGFIPGAVTVTWQADGTTITSGVETTKPTKVNDKYMAASYLSLDKAEWERRNSFTCKVTHEGSPYSKTINRSQCA